MEDGQGSKPFPPIHHSVIQVVFQQAKRWYQNTARRRSMRERFQLGNKVTLKKVICWEKRNEIEVAVRELSGAEPGMPEYIANYSKGLQQVTREMSREETLKMEEVRGQWTGEAHPPDLQRRYDRARP